MTNVDGIAHGSMSGYRKGCRCDECRAVQRAKAQAYYRANKERILERNRKWARENPEKAAAGARRRRQANPQAARDATARWRRRHPERARELDAKYAAKSKERYRRWAVENRDKVNAAAEKWRNDPANKEKIRLAAKKRRALVKSADVREISPRDWLRLLDRCRFACFYCGESPDEQLTVDHVVPLSRGGRHSIGNIVPACKRCNSSKHDRLIVEWLSK